MNFRSLQRAFGAALFIVLSAQAAQAHGAKAGDIEITHPYATPTPPGASNGAAYIATLENVGKQADRLLKISTPVAQRAEIHTMAVDSGGVMRMREAGAIELPPGATLKMHPGNGYHFMLIGLRQPLKDGDSFPLTMEFEHAGKSEVKVIVQIPKAPTGAPDGMTGHTH